MFRDERTANGCRVIAVMYVKFNVQVGRVSRHSLWACSRVPARSSSKPASLAPADRCPPVGARVQRSLAGLVFSSAWKTTNYS